MPVLVVAAISARLLAEAAAADGYEVVALDLFGDRDTRRAAVQWLPIGTPGTLTIDAERLAEALAGVARRGDVAGWICGAGFDGRPELLARTAALLPLIGNPAETVRRVRDPNAFFEVLDRRGIAHPPVQMTAPADAAAWLVKDAGGCGGWHIRRARPHEAVSAPYYLQREAAGTPMSATFVANGSGARVLGFNALSVRPLLARPLVYCGAVGPVALRAEVAERVGDVVGALAAAFALRGAGSLDFLLDGDRLSVLEVNPRLPASIALYRGGAPGGAGQGVIAAHLGACLHGVLPPPSAGAASTLVHGTEIVFAPHAFWLNQRIADRLAMRADCHDLPMAAAHFEAGAPLCSVSASGAGVEPVRASLRRSRAEVYELLEIDR